MAKSKPKKQAANGKGSLKEMLSKLEPADDDDIIETTIVDEPSDKELEAEPAIPLPREAPRSRSAKPKGRKPTAPSLLRSINPMLAGQEDKLSDAAHFLEDYNALERLLEPGSPEDLDARSDLNELQILHYARAEAMAEFYHSKILKDFVLSLKRKMISKQRKGRKEFVQAFQSSQYGEADIYASASRSIADKLSR